MLTAVKIRVYFTLSHTFKNRGFIMDLFEHCYSSWSSIKRGEFLE